MDKSIKLTLRDIEVIMKVLEKKKQPQQIRRDAR